VPVFRRIHCLFEVKDHSLLVVIEELATLWHRWHVRRTGSIPAELTTAEHALDPHPLCHDNCLGIDPPEIGITVLREKRLQCLSFTQIWLASLYSGSTQIRFSIDRIDSMT
jgi:hypothetical protein